MKKTTTGPRITDQSLAFYPTIFSSTHTGLQHVLEAYPVLYKKTMHDLKGQFTKGELSLIIDVFNAKDLMPQRSGQHIVSSVTDGIELDHLDGKWDIDGQLLIGKLSALTIFQASCMEVWANGFWYRHDPEEPLDLEGWVKQLL
jgi:hypothetical protein